ncbi:hypothetical protein LCGC14_2125400 [marine sediment metagenome]|uniref:Uncharacterized protein n=1 Tax=marine sediment metagenome TaxID=412755 RepID=A0A0F9GZA7_9ZZZZ
MRTLFVAVPLVLILDAQVEAQPTRETLVGTPSHPIEREIPDREDEDLFAEWCNELVETIDHPDSRYHYNRMDMGAKHVWLNTCRMRGMISPYQIDQMIQAEIGLERQILDNLNCLQIRNDLKYADFSSWTLGYLDFLEVCTIADEGDIANIRQAFGVRVGWMNDESALVDERWAYPVIDALPRSYLTQEELELVESWENQDAPSDANDGVFGDPDGDGDIDY